MRSLALLLLVSAPLGVLSQRVSTDATCGGSKGYTCLKSAFGKCCSRFGWCGSSQDYCGTGCNIQFGECNQASSTRGTSSTVSGAQSTQSVTTNGRCGASFGGKTCLGSRYGDCCSQYSYCGSSIDHCAATTCQKGYGKCNTIGSSRSSSQRSTTSSTSTSARSPTSVLSSAMSSSAAQGVLISSSTATLSSSVLSSNAQSVSMSSSTTASSSSASQLVSSSVTTGRSSSPANSISSSGASSVPASSPVSSTDASSETPTPTPSNNDSPPYTPTAPVVTPSDPADFAATYTFQDDPLPTPVEMGTAPITTGPGVFQFNEVKKCLIVPTQADVTFELLDAKDRIPLVRRADGTFGATKAPASEAEFLAMGPIEDLKFTSYSFVANANGLFDLVTNESPRKYIARKPDGSVALTDQSTGSDTQIATSIFDITCEGRITVRIGTQYYTWTLRDNDSVMTAADGTPETVYALPNSQGTKRRRDKSQDGQAPRCPPVPRPLEARVFPGARGNNPNQCGSASFNVPDLTFGSCCDQHDNDFDDCGMTFDEANSRFHSCMRGRGCDSFNHWYSYFAYLGCLKTADFYNSVVSGYFGKKAFYEANNERCKCYCPNATPNLCSVGGTLQCLNVFSSDTNNCGACGRKCPEGSRCVNGQCKCPVDQCGDRCVTLASHPKHCGQCNRVSPSGYCIQGQFYTPPPFCSRGNGFKNGNFANGVNTWTGVKTGGGAQSNFFPGSDGAAEDADGMAGVVELYPPNGGFKLNTVVKMCPGLAYNLRFQMRRPYGTDTCYYGVYVAGELKASGQVPLPVKPIVWQWISASRIGPFTGERSGVTQTGPELWVDFMLDLACGSTQPNNFIRVDQFSITPA